MHFGWSADFLVEALHVFMSTALNIITKPELLRHDTMTQRLREATASSVGREVQR